MQQRRERQGVTGFATGFDVLSPDEQRKRAERAARYGASLEGGGGGKAVVGGELAGDPAGALVVDVLEPRRDALGDALVRHECVYVYGVDHLSTKECMSYFGDYAPVFVEWINDSSCNVVFADAFTAKRAMYGKARGGMVWWGVASRPHIPRVRLSDAPSRRPTNQHQGVPETTTPATEAPDAGAPAAADEAPMEGDAPTAPIAPEEDGAGGDAVMTTGSGPHPECFFFKGALTSPGDSGSGGRGATPASGRTAAGASPPPSNGGDTGGGGSALARDGFLFNSKTKKTVKIGSKTYDELVGKGYVVDEALGTISPAAAGTPASGGSGSSLSSMHPRRLSGAMATPPPVPAPGGDRPVSPTPGRKRRG